MCKDVLLLATLMATVCLSSLTPHNSRHVAIKFDNIRGQFIYTVEKFDKIIQKVYLDTEFGETFSEQETQHGFNVCGLNQKIEFEIIEDTVNFTLIKVSSVLTKDQTSNHCVDLATGSVNWFGGPQTSQQYWPVEKQRYANYSYVPKQQDNFAVAERYWLNSLGGFIYVDEKVPLFLNQNVNGNKMCFSVKSQLPYNTRRTEIVFVYNLGFGLNAKEAHMKAVEKFLKKPNAIPDQRMIKYPIWSTWARYKRTNNQTTVDEFAKEIEMHNFTNSQIEIDDDWEICYGALTFRTSKFPNIRQLTDDLKKRGFRVTLWVHPFINKGCEPWYSEAKNKGFFVKNYGGNPDTTWWNSGVNDAAYIDFTKAEAVECYQNRLKRLRKDSGVDSFKFDAGETSWSPADPKLNADLEDHPLAITKAYIRAVATFGSMIEVRLGQGTQDLPVFVRLLDKNSDWTFDGGLPTLITSLLQMNLVGYGFILPDMIGGNGYDGAPSEELFLRWLQANVFMPCLQLSYVPWDYSEKTIEISKKFIELHTQYADEIMKAFAAAVEHGEPVNPPIWWIDPNDHVALGISDEFLLGDRILAAPVISPGAMSRDVYLPKGKWLDPNQNKTFIGPRWLMDYPAPIHVLPYFKRADNISFIQKGRAQI